MLSKKGKKLLATAALVSALGIASCGGGNNSASEDVDSPALPSGTIRVVVPFGAGGGTDGAARALVAEMNERTDSEIIVENIEGGGGTLGLAEALTRAADGTSIGLVFPSIHAMGQELFDGQYDLENVEYLGGFYETWNVVGTTAESGIDSLDDLIELGEDKGRLVVVSGPISPYIVTAKGIAEEAGADLDSIAYEGVPQAFAGLAAGDGDFWMGGAGTAIGLGDEINALAYAGPERSPYLPDVPTLDEQGYDIHLDPISAGLVVPSDTPEEVVEALVALMEDAATSDELQDFAEETQTEIVYRTPEEFKESTLNALDVVRDNSELLTE